METRNEGSTMSASAPTSAPAPAEKAAPEKELTLSDAKKPEDLVTFPQDADHARTLAAMNTEIKVPTDLSKVSNAKAKELVDAGLVEDADLPGKMYKRKADGFVTRIPNYIYDAYVDVHKDEWEEVKLTSDPDASK